MNHMTVYFLNEYHPLVALTSIGKVSRKVRISEGDLFSLFASRQNQPENDAARFVLHPISTFCQTEALILFKSVEGFHVIQILIFMRFKYNAATVPVSHWFYHFLFKEANLFSLASKPDFLGWR